MSDKSKKQLLYDHFNYILSLDEEGNYDLEVLANHSAAYYLVEHRLSVEEIHEYKKLGKAYIETLANTYRHETQ